LPGDLEDVGGRLLGSETRRGLLFGEEEVGMVMVMVLVSFLPAAAVRMCWCGG